MLADVKILDSNQVCDIRKEVSAIQKQTDSKLEEYPDNYLSFFSLNTYSVSVLIRISYYSRTEEDGR